MNKMTKKELIEELKLARMSANALDNWCWKLAREIDQWKTVCAISIAVDIILTTIFILIMCK